MRELSRLDTVMLLISAVVAVDTIGAIAVGGEEVLTWMAVLFVSFFVPSALASAELGASLPAGGGVHAWVSEAFGPATGGLTSLLYWADTPVWLGGSVTVVAMTVWERLIGGLDAPSRYAFGVAFVVAATAAAILPLRFGKWVPASGAVGQVLLLGFFTVSVVLYGCRHGVQGIDVGHLAPTGSVFVAVVPVLLYSFVGIELPGSATEEMLAPSKDLPASIAWAGLAQLVLYAAPVVAVIVVLPRRQLSSLRGLVDALREVLTVYGGRVAPDGTATLAGAGAVLGALCGLALIWVLMASGASWVIGAGRTQAAACAAGAGPRRLGRLSPRSGTPVALGMVTGVTALAVMAIELTATSGDAQRYFSASLTAAVALMLLAYLLVFPSFAVLRHRRPHLHRPFRVPGGPVAAWAIAGATTIWTALALGCALWPGVGTARPDAHLPPGFTGHRMGFELLVLLPVLGTVMAYLTHATVVAYGPGGASRAGRLLRVRRGVRRR